MKYNRILIAFSAGALALVGFAAPASAEGSFTVQSKQRDDQGEARKEMKAGNQLSLREIERRVIPQMGDAEYLGPTYDAAAHAYRLKFIKNGRVVHVDVDARTGKIINRSS
ncbi:MAG: PepSY domain-containing protein [Pseudomonadota bacterium]